MNDVSIEGNVSLLLLFVTFGAPADIPTRSADVRTSFARKKKKKKNPSDGAVALNVDAGSSKWGSAIMCTVLGLLSFTSFFTDIVRTDLLYAYIRGRGAGGVPV